jgi:hypothetical protein
VASLGTFHMPNPSTGMESPVLANVCMGTWDARALVVDGLNRLAVESELIAVDSGGWDAREGQRQGSPSRARPGLRWENWRK